MDCSVIICTHNRAESLVRTLCAVVLQEYPNDRFEIVVVDNGSEDNTKRVVETKASETDCYIRYIYEARLGLSFARNTGIHNAKGDIVLFTDDDAVPDKNWLKNISGAFKDSLVWAAGGDVCPVWPEGRPPKWLHKTLRKLLGVTDFVFSELTVLHYPEYPYGVNIAFRKRSIERLGGFSPSLGRSGGSLLSGEEIELCQRIENEGGVVVYVPNSKVDHVIAKERVCQQWFMSRASIQGQTKAKIEFSGTLPLTHSLFKCSKRCGILAGSFLGMILAYSLGMTQIGFMSKCKMLMSIAYLKQAIES